MKNTRSIQKATLILCAGIMAAASAMATKPTDPNVATPKSEASVLIGQKVTPKRTPTMDAYQIHYGNNIYNCGGATIMRPGMENMGIARLRIGAKTKCNFEGSITIAVERSSNNGETSEFFDTLTVNVPKKHVLQIAECEGADAAIMQIVSAPTLTKRLAAWKVIDNKFVPVAPSSKVTCMNEDPDA